ncbi:FGGY-family carbohydrate kinase, partial [Acinetobacter baumannii]
NLSLNSGAADMVRAVLEGVAYNNRWLHEAVEHFAGRRLDPVRLIGGGAESDLWCQIHADVMDRTIERVAQPRLANLRGAALFA